MLNLALTVSLVILIGPIGTAVATGSTWAISSVLFLFVLHARVDLPASASRRAAFTTVVAGAVAGTVYWLSGLEGLPDGRTDALWSCVVLGAVGTVGYVGALVALRIMSVGDAIRGARGLLRVAR